MKEPLVGAMPREAYGIWIESVYPESHRMIRICEACYTKRKTVSATNRGERLGGEFDHYATPPWCTWRLLEKLELPEGKWLECCAGEGKIIHAVNEVRKDVSWTAIEIRPECEGTIPGLTVGDFLEFDTPGFDVIITNPPFKIAEQIIKHAIAQQPQFVAMLTRLNFLESDDRCAWLSTCMPDVYVLPNRPVFRRNSEGKLSTDATAYGWLVWYPPALPNKVGCLKMLDPTPLEVRKRFFPPPPETAA